MKLWVEVERREILAEDKETFLYLYGLAGRWVALGGCSSSILESFKILKGHRLEQPGVSSELLLPKQELEIS